MIKVTKTAQRGVLIIDQRQRRPDGGWNVLLLSSEEKAQLLVELQRPTTIGESLLFIQRRQDDGWK